MTGPIPAAATAPRNDVVEHSGARVLFAGGRAHLHPGRPVPEGMLAGRYSVLSPGTERRHLAATMHGAARAAGYMTLGTSATPATPTAHRGASTPTGAEELVSGWVLAPAPHGAAFSPRTVGALTIPDGTPVAVAAIARFQLMAELGLDRLPAPVQGREAVVVGSGPVALGCALALRRRGADRIRVVTARRRPPIAQVPGVRCEPMPATTTGTAAGSASGLVIDATGRPERAARLVAAGGTLGLLGTPHQASTLPALAAHRAGWTVMGMHELAPAPSPADNTVADAVGDTPGDIPGEDPGDTSADTPAAVYQRTYTDAVSWLTELVDPRLTGLWCRQVPGRLAPQIFARLDQPDRPVEPVVLFEWDT